MYIAVDFLFLRVVRLPFAPHSMSRILLALLTLGTLAACASDADLGKGLQDVGPDAEHSQSSAIMVEP